MTIDIEGGRNPAMPQKGLHRLGRLPEFEHQCGKRMAGIVYAHLGQPGSLQPPLELYQKDLGVERPLIFLTEDQPMSLICLSQEQPVFGLVRFMAPEGCHTCWCQGNGPL